MSRVHRIHDPFAVAAPAQRRAARAAWVNETAAMWRDAQRAMDRRCGEACAVLDEEAFERLFEEEQAKIDALRAPITAVMERDMWPKELYWGGV